MEELPGAAPASGAVAQAIAWTMTGQVASQVFWFTSLVILAVLLPPRAFGTVAAGAVIVDTASLLLGAGARGSIVTSRDLGPRAVRRALARTLGIGALATVATVVLAGPIVSEFVKGGDPRLIRGLAVSIFFYSLTIVPVAFLQKRLDFKRWAFIVAAAPAVASVVAVSAAAAGAGPWSLVIRLVLYEGVSAALAWWAARNIIPWRGRDRGPESAGEGLLVGGWWFFLLACADFVGMNADYLIVGRVQGSALLGLYSLAFTLAFAPLTRFSLQIGQVFLANASATRDRHEVSQQMLRALRGTALVLLPFLPPALVLAPVALPGVLGSDWQGMVVPFQILLVVGVGHGLMNIIGEFLAATGSVRFRALTRAAWAVAMIVALIAFVSTGGIRGAAIAHACLFVPIAAAYVWVGARRLGLGVAEIGHALWPVAGPVAVEGGAAVALRLGLSSAGMDHVPSTLTAAFVSLGVVVALLWRAEGMADERRALAGALQRWRNRTGP